MLVSILIGVLAALFVVGVIVWTYIKRRRGEVGCGCGCDCGKCLGLDCGCSRSSSRKTKETVSPQEGVEPF